jgi:hypothetical protein
MSFGLKNADATYQRAIQACFKRKLNKNVEAYVDEVVVKTRNSSTLIDDFEETFASQPEQVRLRLSMRRQAHQRYLMTTTTLRGYYSLSRVLTFDYAVFRQRSLSSRHFGLRLRGGSELLGGRRDFFFRHHCRGFIPSQDRSVNFLQSTQDGSNSGGCSALLRFCGHHFFRSSSCGLRALLRSRWLALHLRQEIFNSGGWSTTPSSLPHRVPLAFISLINGLRRRQLLQARKLLHQHVNSTH